MAVAGRMVIVVDDENRENEGDLTVAAKKITPQAINFMAQYGRGRAYFETLRKSTTTSKL
jgi:3,4-dihydroxy-2-butanone 4-phosphate synthase